MKRKTLLSWSGGKDSAWVLYILSQLPNIEITGFLSTVSEKTKCSTGHLLATDLLYRQAESSGFPLEIIELPDKCPDGTYTELLRACLEKHRAQGTEFIAFGDIFHEDARNFKTILCEGTGIEPIFPLWGMQTEEIIREMLESGLKAIITAVDTEVIPVEFAGEWISAELISRLRTEVDPCGENGEYHSFVSDCPNFNRTVRVVKGPVSWKQKLAFAEILSEDDIL